MRLLISGVMSSSPRLGVEITKKMNFFKNINQLNQTHRNTRQVVPRAGGLGKHGEVGKRVQAFSPKTNKD